MKKFANIPEPDRMVFIAKLCHNMWYDDSCFDEVESLMKKWKSKDIRDAVFYPKNEEKIEEEIKY